MDKQINYFMLCCNGFNLSTQGYNSNHLDCITIIIRHLSSPTLFYGLKR